MLKGLKVMGRKHDCESETIKYVSFTVKKRYR